MRRVFYYPRFGLTTQYDRGVTMQEELFHEDLSAALGHVISALGGNKSVGVALWPSLSADAAGKKVANCLNNEHAQQFHPQDILWILKQAKQAGIHSAMAYIASECGYAMPAPIEPLDEAAQLQKEFINAVQMQERLLRRFEKLNLPIVHAVG